MFPELLKLPPVQSRPVVPRAAWPAAGWWELVGGVDPIEPRDTLIPERWPGMFPTIHAVARYVEARPGLVWGLIERRRSANRQGYEITGRWDVIVEHGKAAEFIAIADSLEERGRGR